MDATIGKAFDSVSSFFSGAASVFADEFPLCDADIISVRNFIMILAFFLFLEITTCFTDRYVTIILRDVRKSWQRLREAKTKGLGRNASCAYRGLLFIQRHTRIYSVGYQCLKVYNIIILYVLWRWMIRSMLLVWSAYKTWTLASKILGGLIYKYKALKIMEKKLLMFIASKLSDEQ